jgi:hypothetical protein
MAITDNSFTADELNAAITAKPELIETLKGTLSGKSFVVKTAEEHQAFITEHEGIVAGKKTKEHADLLEKDVLELTGIAKLPNEKYYDYFKRATAEKLAATKALESELAEIKANPAWNNN